MDNSKIGHNNPPEDISKKEIEEITYNLLENKLKTFIPKANTFTPWDLVFPEQRKIHSKIQGLITSAGSVWEDLAIKLATRNGYKSEKKKKFNVEDALDLGQIKYKISNLKEKIESNQITIVNAIEDLREHIQNNNISIAKKKIESGKGIDLWLKKEGKNEIITDIKSAQENIGNGKKLIEHMLIWAGSRLLSDQNAKFEVFISFPYNPYSNDEEYEEIQGRKLPNLEPGVDRRMGDQFWDLISGEKNSTYKIKNAFKKFSASKAAEEFSNNYL
ncbi:MAG: TdeIII family type II restriction endonuclease [Paracoccaceae bacterium]